MVSPYLLRPLRTYDEAVRQYSAPQGPLGEIDLWRDDTAAKLRHIRKSRLGMITYNIRTSIHTARNPLLSDERRQRAKDYIAEQWPVRRAAQAALREK